MAKPNLAEESESDYILNGESVWITVKGFSVLVKKTDEGVVVDIFAKGKENDDCITSTYAFDDEIGEDENERD